MANKDDIERIFSDGSGRGSGTGITSFEWKSLGKNEGNLYQFSAKLKIFLKNIEEMQHTRNSIVNRSDGRTFNVSIMDLIIQKPDLRSGINEGSNIYDPKYFGIKVQVGWHLDVGNYELFKDESRKFSEQPDKILASIIEQKSVFYLTFVSHNFSIKEDGSVELDIDYMASAEIEASDPMAANILRLKKEDDDALRTITQKLKIINRQLNSLTNKFNKFWSTWDIVTL